MLFEQRFWAGIADGSITVTFRRWKRPQCVAGRPYRTPGGIVDVDAVDFVDPDDITAADAAASGYPSAAAVLADLRGSPDLPITRIRFHLAPGPDPRAALAADDALDDEARRDIQLRLDRLDRASPIGPWTRATLELIAANPGVRAPDLAASQGRETAPFKIDVRKLKNLGLTISLKVGYRLSPRGEAFLTR
ncbi:MAG TPA: hypothetical protein VF855_07205 [Acidimicrobiales bacterium]